MPPKGHAAVVDVRLELVAELVDVARDRDRVRVSERAEALAEDAVADVEQQVEIGLVAAAVLDLLEDLREPAGADAARRALAARLVLVELGDADPELHHAAAVVDRDHRRRADRRAGGVERIEVQRPCSTSSAVRIGVDEPPGMTALSVAAAGDAAADVVDQLPERDTRAEARSSRPLTTFPESEKTRVPVEFSTPSFAYSSPPSSSTEARS